jgi:amino acid transporter
MTEDADNEIQRPLEADERGQDAVPGRNSISSHQFHIPDNIRHIGHQIAQEIYYDDDNTEEVQHFQYKSNFEHKFSVGSIVGLGFSLMNVPFGVASTLSIGLVCGSNVTILYGWILFGFFSIMISLSLSEIASKFPTSGGVYHFSCILSNEKYSLMTSWFDGWYLVVGNLLMFVSYSFGGAQFILSIFGLTQSDYKEDSLFIMMVFVLIIVISVFINLRFQSILEKINEVCIYWTFYTVLIADILILLFSSEFHSFKYIFTHFDSSRSGWPDFVAFIIGGIQFSSMTFNGYGAIVAMSEEVKKPEKTIPKGLTYSIFASIFTGLVFIIPLLSVLPELNRLLDDNPDIFPIDIVLKLSTKSFTVSLVISLMIVGAIFFATVGALTTVSRTIYSLSRDKGLPHSDLFQQLDITSENEHVPRNAILLAAVTSVILGTFSLISTSAFNAFLGCSVMAMNVANGIPIICSIMNKRRKVRGSAFKLRKFGYIVNILSVFMIVLTCVILCFPPSININIQSMNYSIVAFVIFTISIWLGYIFWGRENFVGPLLTVSSVGTMESQLSVLSEQIKSEDLQSLAP